MCHILLVCVHLYGMGRMEVVWGAVIVEMDMMELQQDGEERRAVIPVVAKGVTSEEEEEEGNHPFIGQRDRA